MVGVGVDGLVAEGAVGILVVAVGLPENAKNIN